MQVPLEAGQADIAWDLLPPQMLRDMQTAGQNCLRFLRDQAGRPVLAELTGRRIIPQSHYPKGDVYDHRSHSQYYFHQHRSGEYGHFHTFLRPLGMPAGLRPQSPAGAPLCGGDNDALSHLIAIGTDELGQVTELFTTNRWVTAESWYRAEDVIAMLPKFRLDRANPDLSVNGWIMSILTLFRPQIERLIRLRDVCYRRLAETDPMVLENREIEILSRMPVNLDRQLALLNRQT